MEKNQRVGEDQVCVFLIKTKKNKKKRKKGFNLLPKVFYTKSQAAQLLFLLISAVNRLCWQIICRSHINVFTFVYYLFTVSKCHLSWIHFYPITQIYVSMMLMLLVITSKLMQFSLIFIQAN